MASPTSPIAARLARILATPDRIARVRGRGRLLDIERLIVAECFPEQRAFVLDDAKEIAAIVGRGGGKTTGGRARFLLRMARTHGARCLYVATTRGQAEEFMWAPLKDLNERLALGASFAEKHMRMSWNGGSLRLVGADDKREIEKLRGQPFHEVQIDEAASHPVKILEHLVERIIGPRLGDFDGTIVMYGTPGHVLAGEFYEATRPSSPIGCPYATRDTHTGDYVWSTHWWDLLDGVAAGIPALVSLWDRALRTKKKRGWSDDHPVWLREYRAQWAQDDTENVFRYRPHAEDGTPLNQWDPPRDSALLGFAALPAGDWVYVYGLDMGHSDPFALEVGAFDSRTRDLRHVYEFTRTEMTTRSIATLLVGTEWVEAVLQGRTPAAPGGVVGVTGWPYGMVADIAGLGGAILQELREVYGIPIEAAEKKHKHDAIELTNGDFLDGRIKILKGSELETQLLHQQWAVDVSGKLREDKGQRNDCTDAFVYLRRKAMHLVGEEQPQQAPAARSREETEQWLADNVERVQRRHRREDDWWGTTATADEDWG